MERKQTSDQFNTGCQRSKTILKSCPQLTAKRQMTNVTKSEQVHSNNFIDHGYRAGQISLISRLAVKVENCILSSTQSNLQNFF